MIILKYYNAKLKIGLADWKTVYQFPQAEKLMTEIHQGNLYYRSRGSAVRISYRQIRQGLEKKEIQRYQKGLPSAMKRR